MRYPSPRKLLIELSQLGASTTKVESLRLLEHSPPDRWPKYKRRSRESALRIYCCNRKHPAKSRLAALKAVLWDLPLEVQQRLDAAVKGHNE